VFAFAARGIPEKGWQTIVRAVQIAETSWAAEADFKVLMCGDSDYVRDLKVRSRSARNLIFTGIVSDTIAIFSESDCVLLPTTFKGESLPLVLLEALAAQKPVIATNIGEVDSVVRACDDHRTIGWLLELGNEEEMASSLSFLMHQAYTKSDAYQSRHHNAKLRSQEYSIEAVAKEYTAIFRSVYYHEKSLDNDYFLSLTPGCNLASEFPDGDSRRGNLAEILLSSVDKTRCSEQEAFWVKDRITQFDFGSVSAGVLNLRDLGKVCVSLGYDYLSFAHAVRHSIELTDLSMQGLRLCEALETLSCLGYSARQNIPPFLVDDILVDMTSNLAYITIPKNASTALKAVVSGLSADKVHQATPSLLSADASSIYSLREELRTICFIRSPLERLVSCFVNKYIRPFESSALSLASKISFYYDEKWEDISFRQFIDYLLSEGLPSVDHHLLPQNCFMPADRPLDAYLTLGCDGSVRIAHPSEGPLVDVLSSVVRRMGNSTRHNKTYYLRSVANTSGDFADLPIRCFADSLYAPSQHDLVDQELLKKIKAIYGNDFALFDCLDVDPFSSL